jgi:hypothetical protein
VVTVGPHERATRRDLKGMPKELAQSGFAASALELARGMDRDNSLHAKSVAAKAHMELMDHLRELAPPKREADGVDEIAQRRVRRRQGLAATADLPGS